MAQRTRPLSPPHTRATSVPRTNTRRVKVSASSSAAGVICALIIGSVVPVFAASDANASPALITPAQAKAVVAKYQKGIDAANRRYDRKSQTKIEGGPALIVDDATFVAGKIAGSPPNIGTDPTDTQVFVPRQRAYPAHFLATQTFEKVNSMLLFERSAADAAWKVVAYGYTTDPPDPTNLPTTDSSDLAQTGSLKGLVSSPTRVAGILCQYMKDPTLNSINDSSGDAGLSGLTSAIGTNRETYSAKGNAFDMSCAKRQTAASLATFHTDSGTLIATTVRFAYDYRADKGLPLSFPKTYSGLLKPGLYSRAKYGLLGMVFLVIPTKVSGETALSGVSMFSGAVSATGRAA